MKAQVKYMHIISISKPHLTLVAKIIFGYLISLAGKPIS